MTELLAPAGNMACFLAALKGGADAVYLAGEKYGARAYAGNFLKEELIEAIRIAHIWNKKVYLTINTLVKENELVDLFDFLLPFYKEGLDGVIVQDVGAMHYMHRAFPSLELHASTQMTITGQYGANRLKEYGITRIVPARELSLEEIKKMKVETGLEMECFIHGAMCYSYSGQCLFSSMLGQRSGNRGRCAGPCRLPYEVYYDEKRISKKKEPFLLGLKDLCALSILPKLLEAGIDSFKIEGRMKSPAYVFFVTSLYRKYMDLYLKDPSHYKVDQKDIQVLRECYSRGDLQTGYYFRHNGRQMLTLSSSGYNFSEQFLADTGEQSSLKQITELEKIKISGSFYAHPTKPLSLTVCCQDVTVCVTGECPMPAKNRAASKEDIFKQLNKTGNTPFVFDALEIFLDKDVFIPNKMLNELRRNALEQLQEKMCALYSAHRDLHVSKAVLLKETQRGDIHAVLEEASFDACKIDVSVSTLEQLTAILPYLNQIHAVFLSYDLFIQKEGNHCLVDLDEEKEVVSALLKCKDKKAFIFLRMPAVARFRILQDIRQDYFDKIMSYMDGVVINNLEFLGYFQEHFSNCRLISDSRFYLFSSEAFYFMHENKVDMHVLSYELQHSEIKKLLLDTKGLKPTFILPVYGRIPMMESANCVLQTNAFCQKGKRKKAICLVDRYQKVLPVLTHCDRCENTIYNAVPLSLHKEVHKIMEIGIKEVLITFTIEDAIATDQIINLYIDLFKKKRRDDKKEKNADFVITEFTKGHFIKGVE